MVHSDGNAFTKLFLGRNGNGLTFAMTNPFRRLWLPEWRLASMHRVVGVVKSDGIERAPLYPLDARCSFALYCPAPG
jgi:hypothetical protein